MIDEEIERRLRKEDQKRDYIEQEYGGVNPYIPLQCQTCPSFNSEIKGERDQQPTEFGAEDQAGQDSVLGTKSLDAALILLTI